MARLLSLDLGITTGWAVFNQGVLEQAGEILPDAIFEDALKHLLLMHMPTHSVAERPVIFRGPLGTQLEERISSTRRILDHQVRFINPSDWKDTKYKRYPIQRGLHSQHERDAIRIGIWFYDTYLKST